MNARESLKEKERACLCVCVFVCVQECTCVCQHVCVRLDAPVSLGAEVTHQVAGPEQGSGVGAQCSQEDGGSFHIALQPHKPHRDVHSRYVVGITLERRKNKNILYKQ